MTQIGRLTINAEDGQLVLSGSLDETANVIDLLSYAKGGQLALDLGGVTFINSLGVRDWIRMLATAQTKGLAVELRRVSEPIVHQLNMIIATRGNATVTSFFAPYACDKWGREDSLLVDVAAHASGLANLEAPPQACPECGAAMAFNDFPERYFTFIQQP